MTRLSIPAAGLLALLVLALSPVGMAAQRGAAKKTPPPGVYTDAQAARGETLYLDNCVYCHLLDLSGGELAPALTGAGFTGRWAGRPLADVFDYMRIQMPLNSPGGLSAAQNADILAYLLKKSGFPAGPADLPTDTAALRTVTPVRP